LHGVGQFFLNLVICVNGSLKLIFLQYRSVLPVSLECLCRVLEADLFIFQRNWTGRVVLFIELWTQQSRRTVRAHKSYGLWVLQKRSACALYCYCSNFCWLFIAPPAPTLPADRPRMCCSASRGQSSAQCKHSGRARMRSVVVSVKATSLLWQALGSWCTSLRIRFIPFMYQCPKPFSLTTTSVAKPHDEIHLSAHTYDVMFRRRKVRDEFRLNSFCLTSYRAVSFRYNSALHETQKNVIDFVTNGAL
jgi:hypothetical protein